MTYLTPDQHEQRAQYQEYSHEEEECECELCGRIAVLSDAGWAMLCPDCHEDAEHDEVCHGYAESRTRRGEDGYRDA